MRQGGQGNHNQWVHRLSLMAKPPSPALMSYKDENHQDQDTRSAIKWRILKLGLANFLPLFPTMEVRHISSFHTEHVSV